jgi:hypothetical protein
MSHQRREVLSAALWIIFGFSCIIFNDNPFGRGRSGNEKENGWHRVGGHHVRADGAVYDIAFIEQIVYLY